MQYHTIEFITYLKNNDDTYRKILKIIFPDKYSQADTDLIEKFVGAFTDMKLDEIFELSLIDKFLVVEELFL